MLATAVALLLLLSFSSCYERVEGCTDFNAVNFNAMADDPCCCMYPEFRFQFQHRFGPDSVRFFADSVYQMGNGITLNILFLELVAGEFFLQTDDGMRVEVVDEIDFPNSDDVSCPCKDDLFILNPTSFNAVPGQIAQPGTYSGFGFSTGVPEDWMALEPGDFPDGHPLSQENRYDVDEMRFIGLRADITFPNQLQDTLEVRILNLNEPLFFDEIIEMETGQPFSIVLRVNYKTLLQGLEPGNINQTELSRILTENLGEAIEVVSN